MKDKPTAETTGAAQVTPFDVWWEREGKRLARWPWTRAAYRRLLRVAWLNGGLVARRDIQEQVARAFGRQSGGGAA